MLPSTAADLLIVLVAVLPGSIFTWAYERQNSAYGVAFADRVLRFIAVSVIFHLLLAWPEYGIFRVTIEGRRQLATGQFALLWAGACLLAALPAVAGTVLGGLYATRTARTGWTWVRRHLSAAGETRLLATLLGRTPAPRAWDDLFSERPTVYLRIQVAGGEWLAGRFAEESYAGGFPNATDLYLEQAWEIDQSTGILGENGLGFPIYIPADTIRWIDVIGEQESAEEASE